MSKLRNKLLSLVLSLAMVMGMAVGASLTAFADTAPNITSATYDVGTGLLTLTGTNLLVFVSKSATKLAITLKDITITDGVYKSYTLTTAAKASATAGVSLYTDGSSTTALAGSTTGTVTGTVIKAYLNAADETALAAIMDQAGKTALDTGAYSLQTLAGWDGTSSTTDYSDHGITVANDIATLSTATYDTSKGILTLTGNFLNDAGKTAGAIAPKYLTFTDGANRAYTLTTPAATRAGTNAGYYSATAASPVSSVSVQLNAKDILGLQAIFNKTTSLTSAEGNTYNVKAAYGWDGKLGLGSMGVHDVQATNYTVPSVTVTPPSTPIVLGKPISTGVVAGQAGSVYLVPSSAFNGTSDSITGNVDLSTDAKVSAAIVSAEGKTLTITVTDINGTPTTYSYPIDFTISTQANFLSALNDVLKTATATINSSGYLVVTASSIGALSNVTVGGTAAATFFGTTTSVAGTGVSNVTGNVAFTDGVADLTSSQVVGDTLNFEIDGNLKNIISYTIDSSVTTKDELIDGLNDALGSYATAYFNSSNDLVVKSNSVGTKSAVALLSSSTPAAATDFFGSASIASTAVTTKTGYGIITGSVAFSVNNCFAALTTLYDGKILAITVDGNVHDYTIDKTKTTQTTFASALTTALASSATASVVNNQIVITSASTGTGSTVAISGGAVASAFFGTPTIVGGATGTHGTATGTATLTPDSCIASLTTNDDIGNSLTFTIDSIPYKYIINKSITTQTSSTTGLADALNNLFDGNAIASFNASNELVITDNALGESGATITVTGADPDGTVDASVVTAFFGTPTEVNAAPGIACTYTGSVAITNTGTVSTATAAEDGNSLSFIIDGNLYTYTISKSVITKAGLISALNGILTTGQAFFNSVNELVVRSGSSGITSSISVKGTASTITAFMGTPTTTGASSTLAALNVAVTANTALIGTVPTKTTSAVPFVTKSLVMSGASGTYNAVAVNAAGALSSKSTNAITINNVAAPTFKTAAAVAGTTSGTSVTVTPTIADGDSLAYEFSSTAKIATPLTGTTETLATDAAPIAGSVYAYTSGTDITSVSTTNKYLGIFELNANNQVVKFSAITLTSKIIKTTTFTTATDKSISITDSRLGLTAASVASSDTTVATADITTNTGFITIISKKAGPSSITVTVTDANSHTATIPVTVSATGAITIGTIIPYSTFTAATDKSVANTVAKLGIVGTTVTASVAGIVTADLTTNTGFVTITSVEAGRTTLTVKDALNETATIDVTVAATGAITIGTNHGV